MEKLFTLHSGIRLRQSLLILLALLLNAFSSVAQPLQRVYANTDEINRNGEVSVSLNALQLAALNALLGGTLLDDLATIQDRARAVDGDPRTRSSLTVTAANVSLLGLNVLAGGMAEQILRFPATDLPVASSPVTVKIGTGSSLLDVLDGVTIQAMNGNTPVGPVISRGSGNLAGVLNGNNQQEVTFIPGVAYDGIRVRLSANGPLLAAGVFSTVQIYHAYFLKPATSINCDAPIDVLAGSTGTVAALGGVSNEWNAIDGDLATSSTMTSGANVIGSVRHTTIFPGLSTAGDTLRFYISVPGTLVDAQLLTAITVETANGTTSNGVIDGSGGLLQLRLIDGPGNLVAISYVPAQAFDRATIRLGGVLNALAAINLHEVQRIIPKPSSVSINGTASTSAAFCEGTPVTLAIASPQPGVTYTWYTQPTAGIGTAGTTFSPGALTAGTYNYYVDATRTGCTNASGRTTVTITINPAAVAADLSISTSGSCAGSPVVITPSAAAVTAAVFKWYKDNNRTQAITDGLTEGAVSYAVSPAGVLTVTGLTAGTNVSYFASVTGSNRCENNPGNLKEATVTVAPIPAQPTVSGTVVAAAGETVNLAAQTDPGNTITWYADPSTALATGDSYNAGSFSTPGTYTFYASAKNASGCESARIAVSVLVTGPFTPVANCSEASQQQAGTSLGCILCSITNPINSVDNDPANFTRLNIPVGLLGGSVFQRLIFQQPGIAADSVRVSFASPGGLADINLLGGVSLSIMNGNTVVNSYAANAATVRVRLLGGDRYMLTVPAGGAFDRVEIRLTGVLNLLTSLDVYGAAIILPRPAVNSANVTACQGTTTVLDVTPVAGTSIIWYADASGGPVLGSGNTFTTPQLNTAGTVTYYAEIVQNGCPDPVRVAIPIAVQPLAAPAAITSVTVNGQPGGSVCDPSGNATITVSSQGISNPVFYLYNGSTLAATNSTGIFTVSATPGIDYTYTVGVSGDNVCQTAAADRKSISFRLDATAPPAAVTSMAVNGSAGGPTCATIAGNALIQVSSSGIGSPVYYLYNGSTLVETNNTGTFSVPVTAGTNYTYSAGVSGTGVCETAAADRKSISFSINNAPAAPALDISGTTTVNAGGTLRLEASSAGAVSYAWFKDGTPIPGVTGAVLQISPVTSANAGQYTVSANGANGCASHASAAVTVLVNGFQAWKTVSSSNSDGKAHAGDVLTYTIRVRNTGSAALSGTTVSDPVPANTTYVAGSGGTLSSGIVQFTIPSIAVGAVGSVSFQVKVNADLTGVTKISNLASVSNGSTTTPTAPEDPQNPATPGSPIPPGTTTDIPAVPNAAFQAWKTVSSSNSDGKAHAGDVLTYTIRVRNTGSAALSATTVSDPVPANTTYVAGSGGTLSSGNVQFTVPSIAVGAVGSVSFQVKVNADLTGVTKISNLASVSNGSTTTPTSPEDPQNPATPGSPVPPGTTTDIPAESNAAFQAWKTVSSSASDGKAHAGDLLTYTIHVRNSGSAALSATTVSDPVPANTTYVAGSGGTLSSGTVQFNIASLAPGAVTDVSFKVKVDDNLTGVSKISNLATVTNGSSTVPTAPEDPENPSNPSAPLPPGTASEIPVIQDFDLVATLSASVPNPDGKARPGEEITYTIAVKNNGSTSLSEAQITDQLPANTTYVPGSGGTLNSGRVEFDIDSLDYGATLTVSFKVTVNQFAGASTISNIAHVISGSMDKPTNLVSVGVVIPDDFFIPNAFTPNDDGKNDYINVYGSNISGLLFRVYNQWGQLIFQTTSAANGWDGTHKGERQPSGVYVYYVDATFNDGRKITKKGTISLLR